MKIALSAALILLVSLMATCSLKANTYQIFGKDYQMSEEAFNKAIAIAEKCHELQKKYGDDYKDTPEGKRVGEEITRVMLCDEEAANIIAVVVAKVMQLAISDALTIKAN